MGQSRWRSLAPPLLVASALIALGACTPQFDLNNSPPPCIKGYSPCPMTGICQPDDPNAVPVDLSTMGGPPALVKLPLNCPSTLTVRQSSSVFIPTPGVRLEDITVATLPGEQRSSRRRRPTASGAVGVNARVRLRARPRATENAHPALQAAVRHHQHEGRRLRVPAHHPRRRLDHQRGTGRRRLELRDLDGPLRDLQARRRGGAAG